MCDMSRLQEKVNTGDIDLSSSKGTVLLGIMY